MKKEDAMNLIENTNKINLRDMIYKNCLNADELKEVEQKDRETVKKMLEK